MFYGSFRSKKSVEAVLDSINENVVKSVNRNWGIDCFVGKVHKKGFRIYHHKAYMKNSFNKTAYGRVWKKDGETRVFYLLISPFLSWRVYATFLFLSLILSLGANNITEYVLNALTFFRLSLIPFWIGIVSQVIPAPFKKEKIDGMIRTSIDSQTVENNA